MDTGPEPSAFFSQLQDDPRVIYRHFVVADSRLDLPDGWRKGAPVYFGISNLDLTLPKPSSSSLKMGGFKQESTPFPGVYFQGRTVSFRAGKSLQLIKQLASLKLTAQP